MKTRMKTTKKIRPHYCPGCGFLAAHDGKCSSCKKKKLIRILDESDFTL